MWKKNNLYVISSKYDTIQKEKERKKYKDKSLHSLESKVPYKKKERKEDKDKSLHSPQPTL